MSVITSLDHLVKLLKIRGKLAIYFEDLDPKLAKFFDRDPCGSANDHKVLMLGIDSYDISEGHIKFIHYDPSGPGGSCIITQRFKHHGSLVDVDYCIFGSKIEPDTCLEFSLV